MGAPDASLTKMEQDANDAKILYETADRALLNPNGPKTNELVLAYARQISGQKSIRSMPQLELEFKAGTLGERVNSRLEKYFNGTIDRHVMMQMVVEMRANAKNKADAVKEEKASREQGTAMGGGTATPAGASDEVYAADGKTLIGHVVNGKFVALGK